MTTAAATRESHPEADNTAKLQKLLDMEHKLKIERLHPLLPTSEMPKRRPVTMQPPPRSSQPLQARRNAAHSRAGSLVMNAAMAKMADDSEHLHRVPTPPWRASKSNRLEPMPLSRAIPQPPKSISSTPGNATPTDEDKKSDASSICHSPSWEGYGQRKKEKKAEEKQRRKDKEQAEKDARDAKRKTISRLTKKPPSASRTSMIQSGRSTSTPELLDQTNSRRSSLESSQSQLQPPPKHGRQRSSSVASQIRAALTGYLGGKEEKEKETGFVGGLKLEMERDPSAWPRAQSNSPDAFRPPLTPGPQKAHSFGPDAMASAATSNPMPPTLPRTMTDGPLPGPSPLRHKGPPPLSMRASSRSESLISPTAPPVPDLERLEKWRVRDPTKPAADATDHAANASESEAEDGSRGRLSGSYVHHQRQLSQERAISGYKDDAKVAVKSRYPPQAHRRYQNVNFGTPTDSSSPTSSNFGFRKTSSNDSRSSSTDRGRFMDSLGTFGHPYHAPSLDLTSLDGDAPKANRERSASKDKTSSRSFKGAMQAAFKKVRSSSKPPSASSSFFERQSRDSMTTPDSYAMSRPTSSDVEKTPAMNFTLDDFKPPVIKDPNSVRSHSSASSSLYEESMQSPVYTNTPDSSRPQSDKGLPPVVGEVGKGRADTLLVTNDERVFRLSHRATVADSTPAASSPLTPKTAFNLDLPAFDNKATLARENSQGHIHPLLRKAKSRPAAIQTDQSSLTPLDSQGPKSSLMSPPLETTPVPSPRDRSPSSQGTLTGDIQKETDGTAGASLIRAPSLSKSKSTPNVIADARRRRDDSPLVPPQRSPAREKHALQSSLSLPDALDAAVGTAVSSSSSPNLDAYLEDTRKAAPTTTTMPRSMRPSRGAGGRGEVGSEPIAKMFVECCHCKFFHDMPSRVYECMAHPNATVEDPRLGVSGAISTVVNCPWCRHGMTTECCAGYAAVVHLKERLH